MYSSPAIIAVNGSAREYCIAPAIYDKKSDTYRIDIRASSRMIAGNIVVINCIIREEPITDKKNTEPKVKKVTLMLDNVSEGLYYTVSSFEGIKYPIVFDPPSSKSFTIFVPYRAKVQLCTENDSNIRLKYISK